MNSLLINSIRLEYENSPLSLEDICNKNKVSITQLGDTTLWSKIKPPSNTLVIPANITEIEDSIAPLTEADEAALTATLFKKSLLKTAKSLVSNINYTLSSNEELAPKDIKDLATTLLSLKDAIIGKDPAVQVNLQQNNNTVVQLVRDMIKGYSDDC